MITATDILQAAETHLQDRAATYDKPEGERSMGATVEAFKAVTGHHMTEEQGWLFMAMLKAVRSQQGDYRADSYEDGAAYFALAGESASSDRKKPIIHELYPGGWTPEAIKQAAFPSDMHADADESRMDVIGQNGNDGLHYPKGEWIKNKGEKPDLPDDAEVEVTYRDGDTEIGPIQGWRWSLNGTSGDITHYRVARPEHDWIPSNGKKPDLPDGTLVDVQFSDELVVSGRSEDIWAWRQGGDSDDITHYRIHQPE